MTAAAESSLAEPLYDRLRNSVDALTRSGSGRLRVARLTVPARGAECLLRLDPGLDASYWAEPDGYEHASIGAVSVLSARGSARFAHLAAQAERVFAELASDPGSVRLFGGFAFQAERAATEAWKPFGEARFVVPRVSYERRGERAELSLLLTETELASATLRQPAIELAVRALATLSASTPDSEPSALGVALEERPESEFNALIEQIGNAIAQGDLEKVVLARRVGLRLSAPIDAARVLRRLSGIAPECLRFAFRSEGSVFLGATPERLVAKRGTAFQTEALAGSMRIGDASPARLLESQKERAEHAIVVREVVKTLEPLAISVEHAAVPEIHRLRHLAHLRTRIRGTLRAPLHVLDLVERLHPTPAVGGFPAAQALAWIAEHEPDERGWYAGPIGWLDSRGDGQFAVALRSGLFKDRQGALYAGGGIVHGSDAVSELAETRWKLQALLGALEVGP